MKVHQDIARSPLSAGDFFHHRDMEGMEVHGGKHICLRVNATHIIVRFTGISNEQTIKAFSINFAIHSLTPELAPKRQMKIKEQLRLEKR